MKGVIIITTMAAFHITGSLAVFEWIHPESWRRETREAVEQGKTAAHKDVQEIEYNAKSTLNQTKESMVDGYQRVKESVKEGTKSARYLQSDCQCK
jgi:hypothetical protein